MDHSDTDEEEGPDVFEVEEILDIQLIEGVTKYKVRWKNFGPADDTWEPEDNVRNCWELVENFLDKKKKEEEEAKRIKKDAKKRKNDVSLIRTPHTEPFYEQLRKEEMAGTSSKKNELVEKKAKISENTDAAIVKPKGKDPESVGSTQRHQMPKKKMEKKQDHPSSKRVGPSATVGKSNFRIKIKKLESAQPAKRKEKLLESGHDKAPEQSAKSRDLDQKRDKVPAEVESTRPAKRKDQQLESGHDKVPEQSAKGPDLDQKRDTEPKVLKPGGSGPENAPVGEDQGQNVAQTLNLRVQLCMAVQNMDLNSVKCILRLDNVGACQVSGAGETLLMKAASNKENAHGDNCAIIEALYYAGARLNMQNNLRETATMIACQKKGSLCCLKKLLTFAPNLNLINRRKENVLFMMVKRRRLDMVSEMLARGVEYGQRNVDGQTVMDMIDDQLKKNPQVVGLKQMQDMLNELINKMETAFSPIVSYSCGQMIIPKTPLFHLRYFLLAMNDRKVVIEFDQPKELQAGNYVLITFIGVGKYGDTIELHPNGQDKLIDKVHLNRRLQDDVTMYKTRAAFSSRTNTLHVSGNRLEIAFRSKVESKTLIMVRTYACEIAPQ